MLTNLRFLTSKKLLVLLFFIIIHLSNNVEASKSCKRVQREMIENEYRTPRLEKKTASIKKTAPSLEEVAENEIVTGNILMNKKTKAVTKNEGDNLNEKITTDENNLENTATPTKAETTKKKSGFWSAFGSSLSMIFFVEFGDKVIYLVIIDFLDDCIVYHET